MLIKGLNYFFVTILLVIFSMEIMTAQNLSQHQWKNRILVLHFDKADQENYIEQLQLLAANKKGLKERKLVIYQVSNQLYRRGFTDDNIPWKELDQEVLKKIIPEAASKFSVSLIGLDGGVKLQKLEVLTMEELFGMIDSMPMRIQELRNLQKENE